MTDDRSKSGDEAGEEESTATDSAHPTDAGGEADGRDVTTYLTYGGLALLSLLALVATFRFYTSASRAIGLWIAPAFEPVIQAAFNLAVVLIAALGISVLLRRLR